jgi:enterochelin esterase-like enzyme
VNEARSPRLAALRRAVAEGGQEAVDAFWAEVGRAGAPLVEPIEGRIDQVLVTLLWRAEGDADEAWVLGGPGSMALDPMERLDGTDLFFATYALPADTRCAYQFLQSPPPPWAGGSPSAPGAMLELLARARPDPLNPRSVRLLGDEHSPVPDGVVSSVLELPGAPPEPWFGARPGVPAGALECLWLSSEILGNRRRVWVHVPAGYDPDGPPYPWLVAFDGKLLVDPAFDLPTTLDNLAAAGATPAMVAVLVDNAGPAARVRELPCSEDFVAFLEAELVPLVRDRWHLSDDPARAIVAGASFGGLASVFAALRLGHRFANVVSNSGSFWWSPPGQAPEWLTREIGASPAVPRRAWLDVGAFERGGAPNGGPGPVEANRRLRDALVARGCRVDYSEFSGNHHPVCWRRTFADALVALTADWERRPADRRGAG